MLGLVRGVTNVGQSRDPPRSPSAVSFNVVGIVMGRFPPIGQLKPHVHDMTARFRGSNAPCCPHFLALLTSLRSGFLWPYSHGANHAETKGRSESGTARTSSESWHLCGLVACVWGVRWVSLRCTPPWSAIGKQFVLMCLNATKIPLMGRRRLLHVFCRVRTPQLDVEGEEKECFCRMRRSRRRLMFAFASSCVALRVRVRALNLRNIERLDAMT